MPRRGHGGRRGEQKGEGERDDLGTHEGLHARLGGGVVRPGQNGQRPSGLGRDVDDLAAALALQDRQHRLRHQEHAFQVGGDDAVPVLFRQPLDGARARTAAGIVDQHVDAAEGPDRALDQRCHLGLVGNIGGNAHRVASQIADLSGDRLDPVVIAAVDHHLGALAGETERDFAPDARGCAGDQRDFIRERHPCRPSLRVITLQNTSN